MVIVASVLEIVDPLTDKSPASNAPISAGSKLRVENAVTWPRPSMVTPSTTAAPVNPLSEEALDVSAWLTVIVDASVTTISTSVPPTIATSSLAAPLFKRKLATLLTSTALTL